MRLHLLALAALALAGCGPAALEVPAVVRGHTEVEVRPDGSLVPLALDPETLLGLCLQVPPETDTSRWEARLSVDGAPSPMGWAPPAARAGTTVCFEGGWPESGRSGRTLSLCGELIDRFDGSERRLPCRPVRIGGDRTALLALSEDFRSLMAARPGLSLAVFLERLDRLAAQAGAAELPLLEIRCALVAVHFLTREGTPETLADAERRLARLPAWLARDEASRVDGQVAYHRARLADARGDLAAAWQAYAEAQRRYAFVADPGSVIVTMQQADLLSEAGAARDAVERLRADLALCERDPCEDWLLPYARLQLAWLILLDPDSAPAELAEAETLLVSGLREIAGDGDPLESANHRINLAFLRVRRGGDPSADLALARSRLSGTASEIESRDLLAGWADLVEALAALERGRAVEALALCSGLAAGRDPRLAARALSCAAEARRLRGDLAGAGRAFSQALAHHEHGDAERLGLRIPLGPGQRAEDFAQAARVAVESGDPARAWDLLRRLDRISAHEGARRRCRERAGPAERARWAAIDAESEALQRELAELDGPVSAVRREEVEIVRRSLQERLRALWREWPGCGRDAEAAASADDAGVGFRAVALEDEVLLLRRDGQGRVAVERRTPLPREELRGVLRRVGAALDRRDLDDDAWRRLTAPLAAALIPRDLAGLEPVTTFAVHGLLQDVPLAALPLPAESPSRWLGEATVVALQPAGARARHGGSDAASPLFVVDPRGDLPGGSELVPLYRDLFPAARLLHREEAGREAFRNALAGAGWVHLDTHGTFEAAFPELSSLELADGPLRLVQLASFPVTARFANLSGCATGRWPITADSGRFGLGGLFARLGAEWVIASRADLEDRMAQDFNRTFYRAVHSGRPAPAAYGEALEAVRSDHRAVSWAGLLLLHGSPGEGGKTDASRLPAR